MDEKSFDETYRVTRVSLKLSGFDPFGPKPEDLIFSKRTVWFYFNMIWMYSAMMGELFWFVDGVRLNKSFDELTFIAPCFLIGFLSTAKTFGVSYNGGETRTLLYTLKRIFPVKETVQGSNVSLREGDERYQDNMKTQDESQDIDRSWLVIKCVKLSKLFTGFLFCFNIVFISIFSVRPFILMGYKLAVGIEFSLHLPLFVKYPFDETDYRIWPLIYLHQFWSVVLCVFNIMGADSLFYVCCLHLKMHFKLLNLELRRSIDANRGIEDLKGLVKKHQELISLVGSLEHIYSMSNLINYTMSSFLICLTGYNVTFSEDRFMVLAFSVFLANCITQVFIFCYFGDMVMKSSSEIADGIYHSEWYKSSIETRRMILIILFRAQKPCQITVIKFTDVNLRTFTKILSTSWSYFALMRTMLSSKFG